MKRFYLVFLNIFAYLFFLVGLVSIGRYVTSWIYTMGGFEGRPLVTLFLSINLRNRKNPLLAMEVFKDIKETKIADLFALTHLASMQHELGRFNESVKTWSNILGNVPEDGFTGSAIPIYVLQRLGGAYFQLEEYEQALDCFLRYEQLVGGKLSAPLAIDIAIALERIGDSRRAVCYYLSASKLSSGKRRNQEIAEYAQTRLALLSDFNEPLDK